MLSSSSTFIRFSFIDEQITFQHTDTQSGNSQLSTVRHDVLPKKAHATQILHDMMMIPANAYYFGTCYLRAQANTFDHCFWELRHHSLQICGIPCSKEDAERDFLPYDETDLHLLADHDCGMATLLPRQNGYSCIGTNEYSTNTCLLRFALRRKALVHGVDFPSVCLRRNSSVYWYDAAVLQGKVTYFKTILMPVKNKQSYRVLAFCQPVTREKCFSVFANVQTPSCPVVPPLTRREHEAAAMAVQGLSNRYIAGRMGICEGTVKKLLSAAYQKCHVSSRIELIQRMAGI